MEHSKDDLTNALYTTKTNLDALKRKYLEFLSMSFWRRLKFLFTGSV